MTPDWRPARQREVIARTDSEEAADDVRRLLFPAAAEALCLWSRALFEHHVCRLERSFPAWVC